MHERDSEYCTFKNMTSLVMTWNAGASKPTDLRYDEKNSNFFREMLQARSPPDVIVFGLQEIVDLEDKRLTASKLSAAIRGFSHAYHPQKHSSRERSRMLLATSNSVAPIEHGGTTSAAVLKSICHTLKHILCYIVSVLLDSSPAYSSSQPIERRSGMFMLLKSRLAWVDCTVTR
jgi:hypothetical protein